MDEANTTLDPEKRKELVWRAQQIFYEQSPEIATDYPQKLEAVNTARWDGWTRMYGGTGAAFYTSYVRDSYMNLKPKAAAAAGSGGGTGATTIAVIVAVVALAGRRRGRGSPLRRRRGGGRGGVRRRPAPAAPRVTRRPPAWQDAQWSGSWSGDCRGLQNRLRGDDLVLGGFDSHVAPPLLLQGFLDELPTGRAGTGRSGLVPVWCPLCQPSVLLGLLWARLVGGGNLCPDPTGAGDRHEALKERGQS